MSDQSSPGLIEELDGPFAVSTHDLTKRFGATVALDGLELRVPEGATYVLVGPNGAGKSTALRIIMELARGDGGRAEVFGSSPQRDGARARAHIGYVSETDAILEPRLPVAALIAHVARYYPAWDSAYAGELTGALQLDRSATAGTLSKGFTRRLQLLLALAHRPPLLLLDEPTDGLDPLIRERVLGILAEHLAATPTTVVISTHHVHELEGLADTVGVISRGRLVAQLRRATLQRRLHRFRVETPEAWTPAAVDLRLLRGKTERRQLDWCVWGERQAIERQFTASGATVRAVDGIDLDEATRVLLAAGEAA